MIRAWSKRTSAAFQCFVGGVAPSSEFTRMKETLLMSLGYLRLLSTCSSFLEAQIELLQAQKARVEAEKTLVEQENQQHLERVEYLESLPHLMN